MSQKLGLVKRPLAETGEAGKSFETFLGPAGEWCNGNTPVFGTVILGSSPSSPATFFFLHIFQKH